MAKFNVYYQKKFGNRIKPCVKNLSETHTFVKEVEAKDNDHVFYMMQGEIWSPNGEARTLIRSKGLHHTSMSVGDIIENTETHEFFDVAPMGFAKIK